MYTTYGTQRNVHEYCVIRGLFSLKNVRLKNTHTHTHAKMKEKKQQQHTVIKERERERKIISQCESLFFLSLYRSY